MLGDGLDSTPGSAARSDGLARRAAQAKVAGLDKNGRTSRSSPVLMVRSPPRVRIPNGVSPGPLAPRLDSTPDLVFSSPTRLVRERRRTMVRSACGSEGAFSLLSRGTLSSGALEPAGHGSRSPRREKLTRFSCALQHLYYPRASTRVGGKPRPPDREQLSKSSPVDPPGPLFARTQCTSAAGTLFPVRATDREEGGETELVLTRLREGGADHLEEESVASAGMGIQRHEVVRKRHHRRDSVHSRTFQPAM